MHINVKCKLTIFLTVLIVILNLFVNHKTFCQEYDELQIFRELPDSLLKFEADFTSLHFSKDVRTSLFKAPFFTDSTVSFSVESDVLSGVINDDNTESPDVSTFDVNVNKDLNWLSISFYGNYYWTSIDYLLIPDSNSYRIVLLKQYEEQFGMASVKQIDCYYFDVNKNKYLKQEIFLPDIGWSDFYTSEDLYKLNMYYLDGMNPSYTIGFFSVDKLLAVSLNVSLDDVALKFLGAMDHNYIEEPNLWDDLSMTFDSLGFSQLSDANSIYFTYPDFQMLSVNEFELAYLYNSFSEKNVDEIDIEFALRENRKPEESLFWNEQYSIDFVDSIMIIKSEMMNKMEIKSFCVKIGDKEFFVVCRNSIGFVSESQLRVFEIDNLSFGKEVSPNISEKLKNEDFGIDYAENVFEKFPEIFSLKYSANQSSLIISLVVNPTFDNKEAEEIISKMTDENKVLEFKWNELIK